MSQVWVDMEVVPITILEISDEKELENLEEGEKITISGKSKGRGFQGTVKRHGFSGMNKTHGTKHHERAPGSIGAMDTSRVIPGKKMAGRMGQKTTTVKNLKIMGVKPENNEIFIEGAVPGMKGSKVEIRIS